jgi:hypothetical protein
MGGLDIPFLGQVVLWVLAAVQVVVSLVELATRLTRYGAAIRRNNKDARRNHCRMHRVRERNARFPRPEAATALAFPLSRTYLRARGTPLA